jgi:hypothetical protein
MKDRDSQLIYEAYSQLVESLSPDESRMLYDKACELLRKRMPPNKIMSKVFRYVPDDEAEEIMDRVLKDPNCGAVPGKPPLSIGGYPPLPPEDVNSVLEQLEKAIEDHKPTDDVDDVTRLYHTAVKLGTEEFNREWRNIPLRLDMIMKRALEEKHLTKEEIQIIQKGPSGPSQWEDEGEEWRK